MDGTEEVQLSRSSSPTHYYSGHKYFNNTHNNRVDIHTLNRHNKYGSFTNNRKHFQNKLISKSTSSLSTSPLQSTDANTPFSQYTPDPCYNILSNESLASLNVNLDPNDYYINSKDDISIGSKDDLSDGDIDIDVDDLDGDDQIGVHLIDSSSNCSFMSSTLSKPSKTGTTTTEDIMHKIIKDNRESSHHPLLGMILVTLSAVLYAALNLSVKALMYETPWQELMFIRMFITWLATLIWMLVQYKGKLHLCGPSHQRLLLAIRAFFLWGAMFTCWWSFEFLPVGMLCYLHILRFCDFATL